MKSVRLGMLVGLISFACPIVGGKNNKGFYKHSAIQQQSSHERQHCGKNSSSHHYTQNKKRNSFPLSQPTLAHQQSAIPSTMSSIPLLVAVLMYAPVPS